jgi:hypothetical protein
MMTGEIEKEEAIVNFGIFVYLLYLAEAAFSKT